MEQILLAYGLSKETVTAIMMFYKNMKVKVRSPDGDTNLFDIVAGVLQGNTLAPYLPRLRTLNVDRSNERRKQMIPSTNYYRRRLHRLHSASCKYNYQSRIPAAQSGANSRWYLPPSDWLVGFYGISTFVGYLTPNLFLWK